MDTFDHRVLGAATGLGAAAVLHLGPGWALAGAATAAVAAGGKWSPDRDQQWQAARKPRYRRTLTEVLLRRRAPGRRVPVYWRAERWLWRAFAFVMCLAPWWRSGLHRVDDPSQHRGITHWPGVPAIWAGLVLAGQWHWPGPAWPLAWFAIAGWSSHLIPGDALFGRQVYGQRGHGIPLAPWWAHHGTPLRVGLKSAGLTAHAFTLIVAVPVGLWAAMRVVGI